jgi:C4-dicarboxylate transporter DctM subunit
MPPTLFSGAIDLLLLTAVCILLFLVGVRILLVFGLWALVFAIQNPTFPLINMTITSYSSLNSFPWVAIPIFVTVGALVNEFEISSDIIEFTQATVGWLPGTVGNTAVYTAGAFSAITGSNAATTASVGEALFEDMNGEGYEPEFSAATIASGGTLGIIIPPSVLFILYGVRFNVPVADLFIAGLIPGLAMMGALSLYCSFKAYREGYGVGDYDADAGRMLRAAWRAKHAFATIAILIGGIFIGWFTPSEAAGAAFAYIIFTGVVAGRFDGFEQVLNGLETGVALIGIIVPIYVTSVLVQQSLSFVGLQDVIANAITGLPSVWLVIGAMILLMLITGSVLDSLPNMIMTAPLLAPVAIGTLGMHPITWGVVFMISDAIGFITPPYGLNLYVISSLTGLDYMRVAYSALPYLIALIVIWLVFFLVPGLNVLSPAAGELFLL